MSYSNVYDYNMHRNSVENIESLFKSKVSASCVSVVIWYRDNNMRVYNTFGPRPQLLHP